MLKVLVFGDSITHAALEKKGGWVGRIREFLLENTPINSEDTYTVYNLGICSDATETLLKRLEAETEQRRKENDEIIIVIAIGINDSYFIHSQNKLRTSPEAFAKNIKKLTEIAQRISSKIIFVGITPVNDSIVDPMPWAPDKSYKNENVKKYNDTIKSICIENNIFFIEIFEKLIKTDYKKLLEDGAHPNSDGHQKIFEIVKAFLIENKIIEAKE